MPFAERPPDALSAEDMETGAPPRGRLWDGTPAADADSGSYGGAGARGARVDAPADAAGARPRRATLGLNARPVRPPSRGRDTPGQPAALAAWDPWLAPPQPACKLWRAPWNRAPIAHDRRPPPAASHGSLTGRALCAEGPMRRPGDPSQSLRALALGASGGGGGGQLPAVRCGPGARVL